MSELIYNGFVDRHFWWVATGPLALLGCLAWYNLTTPTQASLDAARNRWVEVFDAKVERQRISPDSWSFQFGPVETLLSAARFGEQGELIINGKTAALMARVVKALPAHLNQRNINRLGFLVARGVAQSGGQELAELLKVFYRYEQAIENERREVFESSGQVKLPYETLAYFRNAYFGDQLTEHLFGRQHRLLEYISLRRAIEGDASLAHGDKRKKLLELKDQYRSLL